MIAEQLPDQTQPYRFKTKPYKHQLDGLKRAIKHQSYALLWEPGCVAGDTILQGPGWAERIDVLYQRKEPITIWALNAWGERVAAGATAPFLKGVDELLRFSLSSGHSITVTPRHLFLAEDGWRAAQLCAVGSLIAVASGDSLGLSYVAYQPKSRVDDLHSVEKLVNSQESYSACLSRCDRLPQWKEDIFQVSLQLRDDVHGHTHESPHEDGRVSKLRYNHQHQSAAPLTKSDSSPQFGNVQGDEENPTLSTYEKSLSVHTQRFPLSPQLSYPPQPTAGSILLEGQDERGPWAFTPPTQNLSYSTITAIQKIGYGPYYDLHVPIYENYLANGVWNHNTGKSKTAIDYAGVLTQRGLIKAVVIIGPISVGGVWVGDEELKGGQIRTHFPLGYKRRIIDLSGLGSTKTIETLARVRYIPGVTDFYFINYDSVWRILESFMRHLTQTYGGKLGSVSAPIGDTLVDRREIPPLALAAGLVKVEEGTCPILLVADEGHLIKHRGSRRSRALHQLARLTPYRLHLTGTFLSNSPVANAWSQFRYIDPRVFGLNFKAFDNEYVIKGGYGQYKLFGYRQLEDFHQRLHSKAMVVLKSEALDLPDKTFQRVPVQLSPKTRDAYERMAEDMVAEIEEYVAEAEAKGVPFAAMATIILTKLLRLCQLTSGFITDTEGNVRRVSTEKRDIAIDLIENLVEQGEKTVVFYRFNQELIDLSAELGKKGIKFRVIDGKAKPQDRTRFQIEFQNSTEPMVLLCQLAVSLGQDFTAANTAIFYALDYSLEHFIQSQDRVHRVGQSRPVTYLMLQATRSIDLDVYRTLRDNKSIADMLLDKKRGGWRQLFQSSLGLAGARADSD